MAAKLRWIVRAIIENKEWLFSGAAVVLIVGLGRLLLRLRRPKVDNLKKKSKKEPDLKAEIGFRFRRGGDDFDAALYEIINLPLTIIILALLENFLNT